MFETTVTVAARTEGSLTTYHRLLPLPLSSSPPPVTRGDPPRDDEVIGREHQRHSRPYPRPDVRGRARRRHGGEQPQDHDQQHTPHGRELVRHPVEPAGLR